MKKFLKIILTLVILAFTLITTCNYSFAVNTTTENTVEQTSNTTNNVSTNTTSLNETSPQITTTVSSTESADEGILSPTNIINILLIAVGVVIIFLAIAILTKLKK